MKYDVFSNSGKAVASSDKQEAVRLEGRVAIIDEVLKEIGYSEGYQNYTNYVQEMMKDFSGKYIPFLNRVEELAKKRGC
ncbi:MAG: hypothetical protein AABX72_03600 [Nanoarchaeota archaeon]